MSGEKQEMVCPMRLTAIELSPSCLEEKCRWWDIEKEQCCIVTLANK